MDGAPLLLSPVSAALSIVRRHHSHQGGYNQLYARHRRPIHYDPPAADILDPTQPAAVATATAATAAAVDQQSSHLRLIDAAATAVAEPTTATTAMEHVKRVAAAASAATTTTTTTNAGDDVFVVRVTPPANDVTTWTELAGTLLLLTLTMVTLFVCTAAVLLWLWRHRHRFNARRSRSKTGTPHDTTAGHVQQMRLPSTITGDAARRSPHHRHRPPPLMPQPSLDHENESVTPRTSGPSTTPIWSTPPILPATTTTTGGINTILSAPLHPTDRPRITQTDLSTPPPPIPLSTMAASTSSGSPGTMAAAHSPAITTATSHKRFTFSTAATDINLSSSTPDASGLPATARSCVTITTTSACGGGSAATPAEWILHDPATIVGPALGHADIFCVQPPAPAAVAVAVAAAKPAAVSSPTPLLLPSSPVSRSHSPLRYFQTNTGNYQKFSSAVFCSSDKENTHPVVTAAQHQHGRLVDVALMRQHSPRLHDITPPTTAGSPSFGSVSHSRFSFSPKAQTSPVVEPYGSAATPTAASTAATITSSPFMSSAGYKYGNYFRFPEVDVCTPTQRPTAAAPPCGAATVRRVSELAKRDDAEGCGDVWMGPAAGGHNNIHHHHHHQLDKSPQYTRLGEADPETAMRRARLKSISLDSDGAALVEQHLSTPVYEPDENAEPRRPTASDEAEDSVNQAPRFNPKNINQLSINVNADEASGSGLEFATAPPKTPTLAQRRQKAISLDSSTELTLQLDHPEPDEYSHGSKYEYSVGVMGRNDFFPYGGSSSSSNNNTIYFNDDDSTFGQMNKPQRRFKPRLPATPQQRRQYQLQMTVSCSTLAPNTNLTSTMAATTTSVPTTPKKRRRLPATPVAPSAVPVTALVRAPPGSSTLLRPTPSVSGGGPPIKSTSPTSSATVPPAAPTSTLGTSLLMLSTSSNNLKTLPEVMTLTDFGSTHDTIRETRSTLLSETNELSSTSFVFPSSEVVAESVEPTSTLRSGRSILHRRGSNHSLTLTVDGVLSTASAASNHGGYIAPGLSASNYNLKGSHCSLQSFHFESHAASVVTTSAAMTSSSGSSRHKQNLLQRRGSNTSLTLNIHGVQGASSSTSLNRFNSHSSLNISHDLGHASGLGGGRNQRKGLLERRNSNASLTLTIQSRAGLSVSNSNLRGSECSLASNNGHAQPGDPCPVHDHASLNHRPTKDVGAGVHVHGRRFLSSENLNHHRSTETVSISHPSGMADQHHSSATDLKSSSPSNPDGRDDDDRHNDRQCTCPIRNITTKPLSPQTTSEDFKIYLANIQMLQNASNVLTTAQLHDLGLIFERSYTAAKPEELPAPPAEIHNDPAPLAEATRDDNNDEAPMVIDGDETTIVVIGVPSPPSRHTLSPRESSSSTTSTNNPLSSTSFEAEDSDLDDRAEPPISGQPQPPPNPPVVLPHLPPPPTSPPLSSRSFDTAVAAAATAALSDAAAILPPDAQQQQLITLLDVGGCAHASAATLLLPAHDVRQKSLVLQLHQEFWDLPSNYQEKPLVFGSQAKNRYKTILPNEHSRVILEPDTPDAVGPPAILVGPPGGGGGGGGGGAGQFGAFDHRAEPYINANYIKGPDYTLNSYIATQGPMPNTIYEFWLMVHQNVRRASGYQKIAMLTDIVENNRPKCAAYFPAQLGDRLVVMAHDATLSATTSAASASAVHSSTFLRPTGESAGDADRLDDPDTSRRGSQIQPFEGNCFVVQNQAIIVKNGYTIRKLRVRRYSGSELGGTSANKTDVIVYHYWFPDWPDHRSPNDIDVLLDLSLDLLDGQPDRDTPTSAVPEHSLQTVTAAAAAAAPPSAAAAAADVDVAGAAPLPIIHCSAGIGRTGCLAAILNGLRQMRSSAVTGGGDNPASSATVDVLGIVCNLRLQRGGMVQNSEQYELIHRALCLYQRRSTDDPTVAAQAATGGHAAGGSTHHPVDKQSRRSSEADD